MILRTLSAIPPGIIVLVLTIISWAPVILAYALGSAVLAELHR